MAIDRIGKGGNLPQAPEARGTGAPAPTGAKFEVDRVAPATDAGAAGRAAGVEAAAGTSPLARLRSGEIDVHRYIDLKVDEATAALKGMPASELDQIRSALRDQMRTDPGLADLVAHATGKMPTPPEE